MIGSVIEVDLIALGYDERLESLRAARIGLWDTIASATRPGSLDSAIRDVELAPLADLAANLADLRGVGFNGATSAKIGRRALAGTALTLIDLPSSSPAHARMALPEKAERWKYLRDFLA